jgi:hypothetical protein
MAWAWSAVLRVPGLVGQLPGCEDLLDPVRCYHWGKLGEGYTGTLHYFYNFY